MKRTRIVFVKAIKEQEELTAVLYYEYYFWQSYKKKLHRDIMKEVYKGYKIKEIKVL